MTKHHLMLTATEQALADRIDLRDSVSPGEDAHAIYLANKTPIVALVRSLMDRGAIPQRRIDLWTSPTLNPGRRRVSRQAGFAANGSYGEDAITHPNFRPLLRFFLFGADLPPEVIDAFEEQIGNPEWFSGSDIIGLTKKTRELVRQYGLMGHRYPEEFLKLALDCGLDDSDAVSVRQAAIDAGRR